MDTIAIIIPAYLPTEYKTIEETINHILTYVTYVNKDNLFLVYNLPFENKNIYDNLINKLSLVCQLVHAKGSCSKGENLNTVLDNLSDNFKYVVIYDADVRPSKTSVCDLYNAICGTSSKIAYIQGKYTYDKGKTKLITAYDQVENLFQNQFLARYFSSNFGFSGHDAIFKLDILKKINGFNESSNVLEDADLTTRLNKAGYKGKFLSDHCSSSESAPDLKSFVKQRLKWYSGSKNYAPLNFLSRFVLGIVWIVLYVLFPIQTLVFSIILGLLVTKFSLKLAAVFLLYPFFIVFMTIYYFIKGEVNSVEATKR